MKTFSKRQLAFKDFESMGRHWHATHKTKTVRAINLDKRYEPPIQVILHYDTATPDDVPTSIGYLWQVIRATEKGNIKSIPWYADHLSVTGGVIKLPVAPAMRLLAA